MYLSEVDKPSARTLTMFGTQTTMALLQQVQERNGTAGQMPNENEVTVVVEQRLIEISTLLLRIAIDLANAGYPMSKIDRLFSRARKRALAAIEGWYNDAAPKPVLNITPGPRRKWASDVETRVLDLAALETEAAVGYAEQRILLAQAKMARLSMEEINWLRGEVVTHTTALVWLQREVMQDKIEFHLSRAICSPTPDRAASEAVQAELKALIALTVPLDKEVSLMNALENRARDYAEAHVHDVITRGKARTYFWRNDSM